VTRLLNDLFKQLPLTSRGVVGRVSLVADDRLNAVVVHGRPSDRAMIAELLSVLDSSNVPDSLANADPQLVTVHSMDADQVMRILRGVYKSQLESGGQRPEVQIPEGVSQEVATVLQQINAAATGPLLTLEMDEVTNSLIVLAPNELSREVIALTKQLDENARQHDTRDIRIVTLRETNVTQLDEALGELLRGGRNRRSR
jgi:type II secretory pathway component GspD/PulD (secretin)